MNILIVSQYYWPESFMITGLAEELQQRGHQVTVLTGYPNYPSGNFTHNYTPFVGVHKETRKAVKIIRVPIIARGQNFLTLTLNYLSFVVSGILVSLFQNFQKTDLIFCYAPSPATACFVAVFLKWRLRRKLIFWVQDLWPESISAVGVLASNEVQSLVGEMIKFIYKRCDKIWIPSEGFRKSLLRWGAQNKQIELVENWADPFPRVGVIPEWLRSLPAGFRIAFAGNLGKAQDLANLLGAAERLKDHLDIKWIIVGDGSEKIWLENQIERKKLQDSVFVYGRKPYDDMLPLFKDVDALYVSLKNQPIFSLTIPTKVQAYMSAGKPILASLNGEGKQLIEKVKCGLTSIPENSISLAEAVLKMKSLTAEERLQMGENGSRYFAEHFNQTKIINQIESLFNGEVKRI